MWHFTRDQDKEFARGKGGEISEQMEAFVQVLRRLGGMERLKHRIKGEVVEWVPRELMGQQRPKQVELRVEEKSSTSDHVSKYQSGYKKESTDGTEVINGR